MFDQRPNRQQITFLAAEKPQSRIHKALWALTETALARSSHEETHPRRAQEPCRGNCQPSPQTVMARACLDFARIVMWNICSKHAVIQWRSFCSGAPSAHLADTPQGVWPQHRHLLEWYDFASMPISSLIAANFPECRSDASLLAVRGYGVGFLAGLGGI